MGLEEKVKGVVEDVPVEWCGGKGKRMCDVEIV